MLFTQKLKPIASCKSLSTIAIIITKFRIIRKKNNKMLTLDNKNKRKGSNRTQSQLYRKSLVRIALD